MVVPLRKGKRRSRINVEASFPLKTIIAKKARTIFSCTFFTTPCTKVETFKTKRAAQAKITITKLKGKRERERP